MDRVNLNTRELLGKLGMTGKGDNINVSTSTTPVTDRASGSTTETGEINYLDAVPAIDRSVVLPLATGRSFISIQSITPLSLFQISKVERR